jgi:hypothetical protein
MILFISPSALTCLGTEDLATRAFSMEAEHPDRLHDIDMISNPPVLNVLGDHQPLTRRSEIHSVTVYATNGLLEEERWENWTQSCITVC